MNRFMKSIILALAIVVPLQAQIAPPALLQPLDIHYDPSMTNYAPDPTVIKLTINESGRAESVEARAGLPANVVRAIAEARFSPATRNGKALSVAVPLTIQIRRPYSFFQQNTDMPYSGEWEPPGILRWERKGWDLKERDATSLEKGLRDNLESEESRAVLAAYASTVDSNMARQIQAEQISWLVRNLPGSRILGRPAGLLFPMAGPFGNSDGYAQVRKLWMDQLARSPNDPAVVAHAAYFLRLSEPDNAEKLLRNVVSTVPGAATWLGELYAFSAAGVMRVDYKNDLPIAAGDSLPTDGFGKHAQDELLTTADPRVLFSAMNALSSGGRTIGKHQALPAGYQAFCESVLQRVKAMDATTDQSCNLTPEREGSVEAGSLTKQTPPIYPSDARKLGIEGVLKFTVTIQKDGKVNGIELISGPLVFFESAMDAVKRWEYKPTLLNGSPVEVISSISVRFELSKK